MTKISSKELLAFSVCLASSLFVGFGDTILLKLNKNSALTVAVLGTILGFFLLYILLSIFRNSDKDGIFKTNSRRLPLFGKIFNLLLLLFAILCLAANAWTFTNFIISQFLTRNNYYILAIVLFLIVGYTVSKKIEVMGRTMIILVILFLIVTITTWGFLLPNVNTENLYPLWDTSISTMIKGIFIFISFAVTPFFAILAIPKEQIVDPKNYTKKILIGYSIGAILVTLFIFFLIAVYGIELASLYSYPEYSLLKKIHAFNFIERIENIASVIIFISTFGNFILLTNFITQNINETWHIKSPKNQKIIPYVVALSTSLLAIYWIKSHYFYPIYTSFPWISLGILFLLFALAFLYKITSKRKIA